MPTRRAAGAPPKRIVAVQLVLTAKWGADLERPIDALRELVAIDPTDAFGRSDLAAALLRRAALGGSPRYLLDAVEHAAAASEIDPHCVEAHFNHAVALERLFLRSAAADAWRRFLALEAGGPWATEARGRLATLEAPLPRPEPTRLTISPIDDPFGAASELLKLLETTEVRALDQAADEIEAAGALDLADGYRALGISAEAPNCQSKRPAFEQALSLFDPGPLSAVAAFRRLRCDYIERRYGDVETNGAVLLDTAIELSFGRLEGRVSWLLGTAALDRSDIVTGEARYRSALGALDRVHDHEAAASVRALIAMVRDQVGDVEGAWRFRHAALSRAVTIAGHHRLSTIYIDAGRAAERRSSPRLALAFQHEATELDLATGRPLDAVYALLERAKRLQEIRAKQAALDDLAAARAAVDEVSDPSTREHERARIELFAATVAEDPHSALGHLAKAESRFSKNGISHWTLAVARQRALALDALGQRAAALDVLSEAAAVLERWQEVSPEIADQVRLFDRAEEIFDTMIQWAWQDTRDSEATWSLNERSMARWLRRRLGAGEVSLDAVTQTLPPGGILIELAFVGDRLLIWRLAANGIAAFEITVERRRVLSELEALRRAIEADNEPGFHRAAATLHDWLLGPLDLPAGSPLVIVPEPALRGLPFAALFDRTSRTFAVERHTIVTAPSAAVYARAVNQARRFPDRRRTVLAVGDPALDRSRHALDSLADGRAEAFAVAGRYPGSESLVGSDATASAVFAALERHPWAHFATHALPRRDEPLAASLLLAPDATHAGDVSARQLYGRRLPNLELIVLVACGSGTGYISALEGPLDLAHPFLAAGVPRVVATLWSIDDATSRVLMRHFYDAVDAGGTPAEALRSAQRALLSAEDLTLRAPRTWAAFQLIGTFE